MVLVLKYLKSLVFILVPLIISAIISTIINYFDLLNTNYIKYLNIILIIISMFIGGFYLGKRSPAKGWLEGIKIGLIWVFLLFVVSYLGFDKGIDFKSLIYYIILVFASMFGGAIGINKRSNNS